VPLPIAAPASVAFSPRGSLLAVLRDDATLELWNRTANSFALETVNNKRKKKKKKKKILTLYQNQRTCLFDVAESGASSVAFLTDNRIVAGSLSGHLVECDLQGNVIATHDSFGGAVWALAASPVSAVVAVACEDGCVRLFKHSNSQLHGQSLVLFKTLAKQKARITALAWHCRGEILVSGDAAGGVNVWAPAKSVNPKVHIDVARKGSEPAIVWSVAMLRDTTVVTGDSHGHVTWWSARYGTPLHRAAEHAADVLAVAVSSDDRLVFAAGVDAKVVVFQRTDATPASGAAAAASTATAVSLPWTAAASERRHTHDVRAMAVSGGTAHPELLVSASLDCTLNIFNVAGLPRKATPYQLTLTRADERASLAVAARAVVAHHGNSVSLWTVGDAASPDEARTTERSGSHVPLAQSIRCLASVRLRGDALVLRSAASSDLSTLAASTRDSTRLFSVERLAAGAAPRVRRVRDVALPGAAHLCFTGDKLVLATRSGEILMCSARDGANVTVVDAPLSSDDDRRIIALAAAPWDDSLIAFAASDGVVRLARLDTPTPGVVAALPSTAALAVSVSFDLHAHQLVVCCADSRFLVWNCDTKVLSDWSRQYGDNLPAKLLKKRELLRGAMFNPQARAAGEMAPSMYLWSDAWLMPVDLTRAPPAKVDESAIDKFQETAGYRHSFWLVNKFQPVVHAGFVAPNELVVVELPAATTVGQLPKALFRARYGI
jgi:U3 small nucleolar RNA-associated protein 4